MNKYTQVSGRSLALFGAVLSIWLGAGVLLHKQLSLAINTRAMNEATDQLIRRAEKSVDFVVIAYTELLLRGVGACDGQTNQSLLGLIVETSTVADAYIVTPDGQCSAFGGMSADLPATATRETWATARNPIYRLGVLEKADRHMIGVSRGLGTDLEIVVAINADAILFDVLPPDLRDLGQVQLYPGSETPISFTGMRVLEGAQNWQTFESDSARYPISAAIKVDASQFAGWRGQINPLLTAVWSALGILLSAALTVAFARAQNQELSDVQLALKREEIVPFIQPITDLNTGKVIGGEVLARWIKPDGQMVPPVQFVHVIEQNKLDDRLLGTLMKQIAKRFRAHFAEMEDFYLGFNITPHQLCRPEFADYFCALTRFHGLEPQNIAIEVTERQIITDTDVARRTTSKLSNAGFKIAIDDAGTGHNGLASIQLLSVNTIKIDKFFVDALTQEAQSRVMLDMFVSVAQRSDMRTIAEGVETEEQLSQLREAGVDAVQGYLVSKPLPISEFLVALHSKWHPAIEIPDTPEIKRVS